VQRGVHVDDDRRALEDGRRASDHRPMWPVYVGTLISVCTVVWGAAVNVANAAATASDVHDIKQQLYQMQAASADIRGDVKVLQCRVDPTCRSDRH
jgi:hypothetical protein